MQGKFQISRHKEIFVKEFFFREITETEDSLVVQARELNTFPKIKEGTIIGHLPTVQIILEPEVFIP